MPQLQRQIIEDADFVDAVPAARPAAAGGSVVTLGGEIDWAASPARAMHEQLLEVFGTEERTRSDSWSPRAKLAFVGLSSLALWAALGGLIYAIL